MNLMQFLGNGALYANTAIQRQQERAEERANRIAAKSAEQDLKLIEESRAKWLSAFTNDGIHLLLSRGERNEKTLRSANVCLLFAAHVCICKFDTDDHPEIRRIRGGMSAIETTYKKEDAFLSDSATLSISLALDAARKHIEDATPAVYLEACNVFARHQKELVENAMAAG